ncbi:MAG: AMP-binding protein [Steroidobacteraceae bacterium]
MNTITLEQIRVDRETLRQRWYREGYFTDQTFTQRLIDGSRRHADVPLIFANADGALETTVGAVQCEAMQLAGALQARGLAAGDAVVIQMPTTRETLVLYQAALLIGAVIVPVIAAYGSAELGFILNQSRARALMLPDRWRNIDFTARLSQTAMPPSLEHVIVLGTTAPAGAVTYEQLKRDERAFTASHISADSVCALIYTSGTSGVPKGVKHTHNTLLIDWQCPLYAPRGAFLNVWPAGHVGGLYYLLRPVLLGVPQVFMDQWNAGLALQLIERYRVTDCGGTPFFLMSLLAAHEAAGGSAPLPTYFAMGGASVTPEHVKLAEAHGMRSCRGYGMSEQPTVTWAPYDAPLEKRAATDGCATPHNEVRLVDETGVDVPQGSEGEIVVRGPEQFIGYTDESLDVESFLPGGWFKSGDLGRIDADGYVVVTGRKKDLIIRGGENISAREIEDLMMQMPGVVEVAVVGAPDMAYGERVCAFVVLHDATAELCLSAVRAHFQSAGVAKQKTPERLECVADLPRNAAGKVLKRELRERLQLPTTR